MLFKSALAIIALSSGALAASLSELAGPWVPQACQEDCSGWLTAVSDCLASADATYSGSVSTGDLLSAQFTGDLSVLSGCACSAVAVQASESCLSCASESLCLAPALTMQDYSMVCQDPLSSGLSMLQKYHGGKLDFCKAPETTVPVGSGTETSSSSETETSSSSTKAPCPTPARSGRYHRKGGY